jgi:hypothetical protein
MEVTTPSTTCTSACLDKLFCRVEEGGFREVSRYGGDYTLHNLRLFLASKTGVFIPLEGCTR